MIPTGLRPGILGLAGLLGASAVMAAAAAAHGPLMSDLAAQASQMQLFHALALAVAAVAPLPAWGHKALAILFTLGIFCFSGGVYSVAWLGVSWGFLVPFGGSLLALAWLGFLVAGFQARFSSR